MLEWTQRGEREEYKIYIYMKGSLGGEIQGAGVGGIGLSRLSVRKRGRSVACKSQNRRRDLGRQVDVWDPSQLPLHLHGGRRRSINDYHECWGRTFLEGGEDQTRPLDRFCKILHIQNPFFTFEIHFAHSKSTENP